MQSLILIGCPIIFALCEAKPNYKLQKISDCDPRWLSWLSVTSQVGLANQFVYTEFDLLKVPRTCGLELNLNYPLKKKIAPRRG